MLAVCAAGAASSTPDSDRVQARTRSTPSMAATSSGRRSTTTARTFAHPSNGTERAPKRAKRWSSARHVPAEQSAVQLPTGADRLIGLAGLAGAFAAQRVGRLHDRGWSLPTTGAALLLLLNQIRIFSISDEGRSRLNTAFVTTNFVGGAVGSAAAATRWSAGG